MKGIWLVVGTIVVIAFGAGVFYLTTSGGDGQRFSDEVLTGEQADVGATKSACDIFTQDIAQEVLGSGASKSELPDGADASTDDVSVTQCLYELEQGDDLLIANVLVRGAKNRDAYETNRFGFDDTRDYVSPSSMEEAQSDTIENLGDDAYYNPAFKQVNVLVDEGLYWIIVNIDGGSREATEELARSVVNNL